MENKQPKIGINSRMIQEISGGPIFAREIELVELNIDNPNIINNGTINFAALDKLKALGNSFSIHGPYASYCSSTRLGEGAKCPRNLDSMKRVFEVTKYLHGSYIVIHGDVVVVDYRDTFLEVINALKQFCKLAQQYNLTLLIENMVREKSHDRVGVLPSEVLAVIEAVDEENLKFCFDIGHANLAANLYDFDILDFVSLLGSYLRHVHIHDNLGIGPIIDERYGDQHLAMFRGKIDFPRLFSALNKCNVENMVLELSPGTTRTDALKSISAIRTLLSKTQQN